VGERREDVPALVRHFSAVLRIRTGRALAHWSDDALAALARYRWPGNVRELANIVERLVILHAGQHISAREVAQVLPVDDGRDTRPVPLPDPVSLDVPLSDLLDDYERLLISRALSAANGNIAEAARRLRTDRPNLYRRMKRLGVSSDADVTHAV
jgi:two-component system nitrogen regulation response regulator NtrX